VFDGQECRVAQLILKTPCGSITRTVTPQRRLGDLPTDYDVCWNDTRNMLRSGKPIILK